MDNQRIINRRIQRRQFKFLLRQVGSRIIEFLQPIIVFGGLLAVLVFKIPWMRDLLTQAGVRNTDEVTDTLMALTLCAIFLELRTVAQHVEDIPEQRHFADPLDIYPVLMERIREIKRKDEKVLDVLGMDLYTAWPSIGFWLHRPELRDWTIRMTAVVKAEPGNQALFPQAWTEEGAKNLTRIHEMETSRVLASQQISLEAYGYNFVPVIHGYRLGNGDLFYSLLNWGTDGRITRDEYSYEFLPAEDRSVSAEWMRGIFDTWFVRASRDKWPASE